MMQLKEIIKKRIRNNRGFTLIEAIAVLIIISIIAVVVMSRGDSSADAILKSSAEALKGHIRFAQMRAMNTTSSISTCDASFGMKMTGNNYFMFKDCSDIDEVILPGAQSSNGVNLPSGMSVSSSESTFTFDRWGRPCTDLQGNTLATDDITLILSYAGMSESIKITKNTGFVP